MAIHVGKFRPPAQPVSITDGKTVIQFDTPSDIIDYLQQHPQLAESLSRFDWYLGEPSGGH